MERRDRKRRVIRPRPALVAALATGLLLAPAGAARADDAGAERAYRSTDAAATAVQRQLVSAAGTFRRTRQPATMLRLLARARGLIATTRRALIPEKASTPTGSSARAAAFQALGLSERGLVALRAGVLAIARGDDVGGRRLTARADTLLAQAGRADGRARALFASARGVPAD